MFLSPWGLVIHPRILKKVTDVTAGPLSIICQRSWEPGEVPIDCKLANDHEYMKCVREESGNCRPVSLSQIPGKIMKKVILGVTERHLNDNDWSPAVFLRAQF